MKVMCIMANGFEELEAVGTIALFRRANIQVDIYTLEDEQTTGRFQLTLAHLRNIKHANVTTYDALFIPGGPHYKTLEDNQNVIEIIKKFYMDGKIIGAICAAPTILGDLGLLKDRNYTCFTSMDEDFGGIYQDDYAVVDETIVTGKSAAASIEFAFSFMERLAGKELVEKVKKEIYY